MTVTVAKDTTDRACTTPNPASGTSLLAGAAALPLALGKVDCDWKVTYRNTNNDCKVEVTLKGPDNQAIDGVAGVSGAAGGEFSLKTDGRRVKVDVEMDDGSGGTTTVSKLVTLIEFKVPDPADSGVAATTCTTFFTGTVELEITDTDQGNRGSHTGTVNVAFAPPTDPATSSARADCSAGGNVMVPLGAVDGDGATFPGTVRLIDKPVGAAACEYAVTLADDYMVGSLTFERLSANTSGTLSVDPSDAGSQSVSAQYDVQRNVMLELENISTGTHDPVSRQGVEVTLRVANSSCSVTAPTGVADPLVVGASETVDLDQELCDWEVSYNNVGTDCTVKVTVEDLAGVANATFADRNDGTTGDAGDGKFTLYVVNRRLRIAADRASASATSPVVGKIKFEVPVTDSALSRPAETCETRFNQAVSVATTNAQGVTGDHDRTMIEVEVSQKVTPPATDARGVRGAVGRGFQDGAAEYRRCGHGYVHEPG